MPCQVRFADLGELDGYYDSASHTIWLHRGLTQAEMRCTLAHEIVHAERHDQPCEDRALDVRQEASVEREAARRLIGLADLADALRWTGSESEAAELLHVDLHMLRARLASLHPAEAGYLRAVAARLEHVA